MKSSNSPDYDRISDIMPGIFLNAIVGLSLLRFHWFFLVFCLVIIIEFLILNYFWRAWKISLGVSLLANMGSALVALPLLFLPSGYTSYWFNFINFAELLVTESLNDLTLPTLFFHTFPFITIFIISVLIETLIAKVLKAPKENISLNLAIANAATYSLILLTLVGLGAGFGILNQDPTVDSYDFFEGILFQPAGLAEPLGSQIFFFPGIILISGIFGFLCVSGFIIWFLRKSLKKRRAKPPTETATQS